MATDKMEQEQVCKDIAKHIVASYGQDGPGNSTRMGKVTARNTAISNDSYSINLEWGTFENMLRTYARDKGIEPIVHAMVSGLASRLQTSLRAVIATAAADSTNLGISEPKETGKNKAGKPLYSHSAEDRKLIQEWIDKNFGSDPDFEPRQAPTAKAQLEAEVTKAYRSKIQVTENMASNGFDPEMVWKCIDEKREDVKIAIMEAAYGNLNRENELVGMFTTKGEQDDYGIEVAIA